MIRGAALAALASLALGALSPALARAQPDPFGEAPPADYQVGSTSWNGLSTLEALARGMGLEVVQERTLEWDVELIADEPGRRIAWCSLPGSEVFHCGSVRFEPARGARAPSSGLASSEPRRSPRAA